jgi:hypothetical protein
MSIGVTVELVGDVGLMTFVGGLICGSVRVLGGCGIYEVEVFCGLGGC